MLSVNSLYEDINLKAKTIICLQEQLEENKSLVFELNKRHFEADALLEERLN